MLSLTPSPHNELLTTVGFGSLFSTQSSVQCTLCDCKFKKKVQSSEPYKAAPVRLSISSLIQIQI
jgi:hypothetical protein